MCCFGANQNKGLNFFMKTHLVLATSSVHQFVPENDIEISENDVDLIDVNI
jgi:hypothetical protein